MVLVGLTLLTAWAAPVAAEKLLSVGQAGVQSQRDRQTHVVLSSRIDGARSLDYSRLLQESADGVSGVPSDLHAVVRPAHDLASSDGPTDLVWRLEGDTLLTASRLPDADKYILCTSAHADGGGPSRPRGCQTVDTAGLPI